MREKQQNLNRRNFENPLNIFKIMAMSLLIFTTVVHAEALIDCDFEPANLFSTDGTASGGLVTNSALFGLNYDSDTDTTNDSIKDNLNNIWKSAAGAGITSFSSKTYAGTGGQLYLQIDQSIEITVDPAKVPSTPTIGYLSFNLKLSSLYGNGTTYKVQGWNKDTSAWDSLKEFVNLDTTTTQSIVNQVIPDASIYTKYRLIQDGGNSTKKAAIIDNFQINASNDQIYNHANSTFNSNQFIAPGDTAAQILGLKILTAGGNNPYSLKSLNLTLTGSENMTNLKIYATGTSATFATDTLVHTIAAPQETEDITTFNAGEHALADGYNYFWITADVKSSAMPGASLDAACNTFTLNREDNPVTKVPTTTSPEGNLTVRYVLINCGFDPGDNFTQAARESAVPATEDSLGNSWTFGNVNDDPDTVTEVTYWNNFSTPTNGDFLSQHIEFYTSSRWTQVGDYWEVEINPELVPSNAVAGEFYMETAVGTSSNLDLNIEGLNGSTWEVINSTTGWNSNRNITATIDDLSKYSSYRMIVTNRPDDSSRLHVNDIVISTTSTVVTPVIELDFIQEGKYLSWTVEDETDVKEYLVVDNETKQVLAVIPAVNAGTYTMELEEAVTVKLTVVDSSGYSQSFLPESTGKTSVPVDLKQGWNLLSAPGKNVDTAQLSTFGTLWKWDGSKYTTIDQLNAGEGFWLYSSKVQQITMVADKVEELVITLNSGWTLAGPTENITAPENMTIYSWSDSYQQILDSTSLLIAGQGYWIHSTQEQELILK